MKLQKEGTNLVRNKIDPEKKSSLEVMLLSLFFFPKEINEDKYRFFSILKIIDKCQFFAVITKEVPNVIFSFTIVFLMVKVVLFSHRCFMKPALTDETVGAHGKKKTNTKVRIAGLSKGIPHSYIL